jgi:hypothetical protein
MWSSEALVKQLRFCSLFLLPQWLSTVVMGWLIHVYSGNAAPTQSSIRKFHQKISHFLYETYTRTRIEQLFNIIIGEFMLYIYHSESYSCNRSWRLTGLWDVKDPTFYRQLTQRFQWGCKPYTPATRYSPEAFSSTHLCLRLSKPKHQRAAGRIR